MLTAWSWMGGESGWTFPSQRGRTPPPRASTWDGPPTVVGTEEVEVEVEEEKVEKGEKEAPAALVVVTTVVTTTAVTIEATTGDTTAMRTENTGLLTTSLTAGEDLRLRTTVAETTGQGRAPTHHATIEDTW